ncbi:MAG: aspartate kinase [Clostridiales bacterium]|nr:aspartate kinase [Clostridiales bacterium]
MIKVVKFGGSSVADAIQLAKVKAIIDEDPARRYVVVSAPGKRFSADNKITDLLYLCKAHMDHNIGYSQVLQVIGDRYKAIELNLGVNVNMDAELQKIDEDLRNGASSDYMASRGEYLMAKLTAAYLGYDFIDTAGLVVFDKKGRFLDEETNENLKNALDGHERAVLPGFYGSLPDGKIKTFSRGGSDITGSLVARAVGADMYENWTDVSGFLMADPRIVESPKPIEKVTYMELRELSYMGASVLHEDAVFPVRENNIPINIRNTNEPENPGTVIMADVPDESGDIITGIAGRKDFVSFGIFKNMMSSEVGFIRRVLSIFESYDVPIEHIPSGVDTISIVVPLDKVEDHIQDIIEEIERKLRVHVVLQEGIAVIATVGRGMSSRPGVSGKLFNALAEANINIKMIDQGSSEMNIIVGVDNDDFADAIRAIYNAFVTNEN